MHALGHRARTRFKLLAMFIFSVPLALASFVVRAVYGLPVSGGEGTLPVLMTVLHVASLLIAVTLMVEAGSGCFEVLSLLKCRARTLLEIKCKDDDEEEAAQRASTLSLDLRGAEGCIAWAKLREYMMCERSVVCEIRIDAVACAEDLRCSGCSAES